MRSRRSKEAVVCALGVILGLVGLALVWTLLPHEQAVSSGLDYVLKLAPFFALTLAVAFFPQRPTWLYLLLILAFCVFAGFFFPRTGWFYFFASDAEIHGGDFYTHLYLLFYPALVLTVAAAFRLGGGTAGRTLKIAWSGVIVLFSGLLDVMFQVIKPEADDPISAPHIVLFTGRPITVMEGILFALAHVPLLIALLWLPLDRWIDRWLGSVPQEEPVPEENDAGYRSRR